MAMAVGDEVSAIVSALFECSDVDLYFSEAPGREEPLSPSFRIENPSELREGAAAARRQLRRVADGKVKAAPAICDEEARPHRTTVFNGERVNLELWLRPRVADLQRTLGNIFGVPEELDKQLACWNALTEELFVTPHFLQSSHPLAHELTRIAQLPITDELLFFDPNETRDKIAKHLARAHADPSGRSTSDAFGGVQWRLGGGAPGEHQPRHTAYRTQQLTPERPAALRSDQQSCDPAVFRLSFVVRESDGAEAPELPSDCPSHCIFVKVELRGLKSLREGIAQAVGDRAAVVPRLGAPDELEDGSPSLGPAAALGPGGPAAVGAPTLASALGDLDNPLASQGWPGGNAVCSMIQGVWLVEPLEVEVRSELIGGNVNYINLNLINRLTHDVVIEELRLHLPTTVPVSQAQYIQTGTNAATPVTTVRTLTATPAHVMISQAARDGLPGGFEAPLKVECYLELCDGHGLPVSLGGGEMYGFLCVVRPYDLAPAAPTAPPPGHRQLYAHGPARAAPEAYHHQQQQQQHQPPPSPTRRPRPGMHSRSSSDSVGGFMPPVAPPIVRRPGHARTVSDIPDLPPGSPVPGSPVALAASVSAFGAPPALAGDGEALQSQLGVLYKVLGLPALFDKVVPITWRLRPRPPVAPPVPAVEEEKALRALVPRAAACYGTRRPAAAAAATSPRARRWRGAQPGASGGQAAAAARSAVARTLLMSDTGSDWLSQPSTALPL
eukprot:TRINITY_DN18867_c4_g1_i1.p1 TRINITY_DN18867_c4_g1~~TRINITY_DN18867_c4_g1_i1.p1  ORF type:complete len:760 (+),score=208.24 TRINITY_DN18867_c4_g1_i1:98-2281(+)